MGLYFKIEHANIIAYLTSPLRLQPPRLTAHQIDWFLDCVTLDSVVSANPRWKDSVENAAESARKQLERDEPEPVFSAPLSAQKIDAILAYLRPFLSDYDFWAMPFAVIGETAELDTLARQMAYSAGRHALILIPDYLFPTASFHVLDPLPGIREVMEHSERWPGVLFWTGCGESAFVPLSVAEELFYRLIHELTRSPKAKGDRLGQILSDYRRTCGDDAECTILQLSDLHFGARAVEDKPAYLLAAVKELAPTVSRIVITGDLFDQPKRKHAVEFRNFRETLKLITNQEIIVIPGNHDQKVLGNTFLGIGRTLKELAALEWSGLVIDDRIQCVFFCFDSSRNADLARGRVAKAQLMEVATAFEATATSRPEIREFLRIALVHHHPYSFEIATETVIQRSLRAFGLSDEYFLRMDDADKFVRWCAKREVTLILHGHKHVPRYVFDDNYKSPNSFLSKGIAAVGCGTSLGAEGAPLSYNVLRWVPSAWRWSASFFSDPGDGSGFQSQYVVTQMAMNMSFEQGE